MVVWSKKHQIKYIENFLIFIFSLIMGFLLYNQLSRSLGIKKIPANLRLAKIY